MNEFDEERKKNPFRLRISWKILVIAYLGLSAAS
jgi:hypothetical protein